MHNAVFSVHLLSSQFRSARSCRCVCLFFGVCGFMCLLLFICLFCVVFVFQYEHPCLPSSALPSIMPKPTFMHPFTAISLFFGRVCLYRERGNHQKLWQKIQYLCPSIYHQSLVQSICLGKLLHHLTSLAWNVCRDGDLLVCNESTQFDICRL